MNEKAKPLMASGFTKTLDELYIERRDACRAKAERTHAAALVEWEQLRTPVAGGQSSLAAAVRELLNLHKPRLIKGSQRVECEHCLEASWDIEQVEWPCRSYTAIREWVSSGEEPRS